VIEWVYNGFLSLDDGSLDSTEEVGNRLDHYVEILQLAHMWDISELKTHVENRVLSQANIFIRVENVLAVRTLAGQCNANLLSECCEAFYQQNRDIIELVEV
jgi:hypothetical protein